MTREENKAYLRGKIQGMERIATFALPDLSPSWKMIVEQHIAHAKKELAALDIPQLIDNYGADRVKIPSPWEWDGTFTTPVYGKPCFGDDHEVHTDLGLDMGYECGPRLGLRKRKPTRVWFEAQEKARLAKRGTWTWCYELAGWRQAIFNNAFETLCATRHEEYDEAPQIVTQDDVDRVLGGVK